MVKAKLMNRSFLDLIAVAGAGWSSNHGSNFDIWVMEKCLKDG